MKAERLNICDKVVYNYMERSDSLVNAQSPKAAQRKIDGGFMLLALLKEQLNTIEDFAVRKWYDMMIAHATTTLLTLIGTFYFSQRKAYIKRIKQLEILPLSIHKAEKKTMRKIQWINYSLNLFVTIVFIKNL